MRLRNLNSGRGFCQSAKLGGGPSDAAAAGKIALARQTAVKENRPTGNYLSGLNPPNAGLVAVRAALAASSIRGSFGRAWQFV
jgi:hypothetical protein